MDSDILTRLLGAAIIASSGIAVYWLVNRAILRRVRGRLLGLESIQPGVPAVLYFTTPTCAPCKTVQRPALMRLKERLGDSLQVFEVDASARPELADYWGVLSVPTTFIIDSQGRPRRVNHGVASAERLHKQIEEVEGRSFYAEVLQGALRRLGILRNTL
jgi:thioredoxin 1